ALDALWSLGLGEGQLARRDAVGPVGPQPEGALAAKPARSGDHVGHRLAGGDAPRPGVRRRLVVGEFLRQRAGALGADCVAGDAAVGLHRVEPFALAFDAFSDAVAFAARPGKVALGRDLE